SGIEECTQFRAFAIFNDGDEIRIYATPDAESFTPETMPMPRRIILMKNSPCVVVEEVRIDVFFERALPNELRWKMEELLDAPEEGFTEEDFAKALKRCDANDKYIARVLDALEADEEEEDDKPPKK